MRLDTIFRIAAKLFSPFILLFAFYVQMHGDYGPGGGFQAGVIAAATIILYAIIFGLDAAKHIMPPRLAELMVPAGVLVYAGVGVVCLLAGGNYLDYSALDSHAPEHGQHLGILLVEFGVLITVSGTMVTIFYTFTGRGR